jgi:Adenylate and Guanylate cyclase catalytic domain
MTSSRAWSVDETNRSGNDRCGEHLDSPEVLVRREDLAIRVLRILLLLGILLVAGATVSFGYIFTSKSEHIAFATEYEAVAPTIVSAAMMDMRSKLSVARSLAATVTLAIENTGQPVSNLTISSDSWSSLTIESRFRSNSGATWLPFLYTDEERRDYEAYTRRSITASNSEASNPPCYFCNGNMNQAFENANDEVELPGVGTYACWELMYAGTHGIIAKDLCPLLQSKVSETCVCIEAPGGAESPSEAEARAIPERKPDQGIFGLFDDDGMTQTQDQQFDSGPYAPVNTQVGFMFTRTPLLYNFFSEPERAKPLATLLYNAGPVFSPMNMPVGPYYNYVGPSTESLGDLITDLYFPIFHPSSDSPKIVGAVHLYFWWKDMLTVSVPAISDKLMLVVTNTCGQSSSFSIDPVTSELSLLGATDLHDPRFDKWGRTAGIEDFNELVGMATNGLPVETPSNEPYCSYRFDVYPTAALEATYLTKSPIIYATLIGFAFFFTSLLFLAFDFFVQRRQNKVMISAKRTSGIVSSLFPESVRSRLYDHVMANSVNPEVIDQRSPMGATGNSSQIFGSDPIADLFPHATVMFLDLANFTAWSSEREPHQVFSLLETLYFAFDDIAHSLGVFKVETIGDSYVAVAGLPEARDDHAVGTWFIVLELSLSRSDRHSLRFKNSCSQSWRDLRTPVSLG